MFVPWPCRTISSRLSAAAARPYIARAAPRNGWSSSAATNSTGTRRRGITLQAFTAPKAAGPDRLTTPTHRRADAGRRHQRRGGAHRRADQHDPVGTAPAKLLGRRDHVGIDPRIRSRSWSGAAEPLEVEGERLVALLGEPLGPWQPFTQVPATPVGEHQAGVAAARTTPTSIALAEVRNRNGLADPTSRRHGLSSEVANNPGFQLGAVGSLVIPPPDQSPAG